MLVVDRGADDEVESSPVAFELVAGILVLVLLARRRGTVLDVSAVDLRGKLTDAADMVDLDRLPFLIDRVKHAIPPGPQAPYIW